MKRIRLETDGNCLPESQFDQAQYVPELAGLVVDAFKLRVQVVLSLEKSAKLGLSVLSGGDKTIEIVECRVDNDLAMLWPGT